MSYNGKVNSKEEEKKLNERYRPVYSIVLIILLILVSIAYASLAVTIGVKFNKETIVDSGHDGPDEPSNSNVPENPEEPDKPDKPVEPEEPPKPKPPVIPIQKLNWKIEFENIEVKDGSVAPIVDATIDDTKTGIYYEVLLNGPGEYYSFTADIVNSGTMNAKIYDIIDNGITDRQREFLDYEITYADGTEISRNDELLAKQSKKVNVLIAFKDEDLVASSLPETEQLLDLSFRIVYVEK